MTVTEKDPSTTSNGRRSPSDDAPALVDEIVLSTAGTATQGIGTAFRAVEGVVSALDSLVLGVFDIAEQLAGPVVVADLVTKGLAAARQSWSTSVETSRQALAHL